MLPTTRAEELFVSFVSYCNRSMAQTVKHPLKEVTYATGPSREARMSTAMSTIMPTKDTRCLGVLSSALETHLAALVGSEGNAIPIPDEIRELLTQVVRAMEAGRAIALQPVTMTLTTSESVQLLGISRPAFVKLLEEGKIPYSQPRRHRYVQLGDLLDYMREREIAQSEALVLARRGLFAQGFDDFGVTCGT